MAGGCSPTAAGLAAAQLIGFSALQQNGFSITGEDGAVRQGGGSMALGGKGRGLAGWWDTVGYQLTVGQSGRSYRNLSP